MPNSHRTLGSYPTYQGLGAAIYRDLSDRMYTLAANNQPGDDVMEVIRRDIFNALGSEFAARATELQNAHDNGYTLA